MLNSPTLSGSWEKHWIQLGTENLCWRSGKSVYIPILKTAASYYTAILAFNGWQRCGLQSVDWDTDAVFGFIMHPIQRYLKALTEDALTSSKHKDIIEKCLDLGPAHWCLLSTHALPISLILGDLMYHVHWIPIDRDFDPDEMLIEFCNKHGSQIHINSHIGQMYRHESGKDKLDLFRSIRDRFDVGNAHFYRVFSKDIDLYHNICAKLQ